MVGFEDRAKVMSKKSFHQFPFHLRIDLKSVFRNLKSAILAGALLLAPCFSASAQQPRNTPLIGYLDYGAAIDKDEAFFQALRDLGWIERQNIAIEYRWAEGKLNRFPALAKELVGSKG